MRSTFIGIRLSSKESYSSRVIRGVPLLIVGEVSCKVCITKILNFSCCIMLVEFLLLYFL